jgi:hypothetical protein
MKYLTGCLIIFYLILLHSAVSVAQIADKGFTDSLAKKFEYYRLKKQGGVLYAHFDKTVYTNNENVWFTAYLLKNFKPQFNKVLSAVLVRDDDHTIALEDKFVMIGGLAFGNLFLPDTIPAGDYSFILYTGHMVNGKPVNTFIQPVTIKNTTELSFSASLTLADTGNTARSLSRKVLLTTTGKGFKNISGAMVTYFAGNKLHPAVSGKVKTDKAGQYLFTIPLKGIAPGNNSFEASIANGKETKTVKLALPIPQDAPSVKFYPEGGNLSDGVLSTIGWEVKNAAGNPYKVTGVLYKNSIPDDTVNTDSYGMGRFKFYPHKQSSYYLKLLLPGIKDSLYKLPPVTAGLPVISINNAIAGDTLNLVVRTARPQKIYIIVHNYNDLFYSLPVELKLKAQSVKIILDSLPKGIAEITVLDSFQRPCAERLFFAHYDRQSKVKIATDNSTYKTRQKLTIDLSLFDATGKQINGFVSMACVQASRLELKKATDIESYFYLETQLGRLPPREGYNSQMPDDKAYLENILLIKGWRKYRWTDAMKTTAADTLVQSDTLRFKGVVTHFEKPLKKPADIIVLKDSSLKTITTASNGDFAVATNTLFSQEGKKVNFYLTGSGNDGYNISIKDPYLKVNKLLADSFEPFNFNRNDSGNSSEPDELKGLDHVIRLKEVKIKGGDDGSVYGSGFNANKCGDYVCMFNILNCQNHRNNAANRPPVVGQVYHVRDVGGTGLSNIVYQGCYDSGYSNAQVFKGIYYSAEFYPEDYAQLNPPAPEYLSTIYWKHLFKLSAEGKNEVSFYTSDITGPFKIIVQGIGDGDVVSGEKTFMVNKQ